MPTIRSEVLYRAKSALAMLSVEQLDELAVDECGWCVEANEDKEAKIQALGNYLYEDYAYVIVLIRAVQRMTGEDIRQGSWFEADEFESEEERLLVERKWD